MKTDNHFISAVRKVSLMSVLLITVVMLTGAHSPFPIGTTHPAKRSLSDTNLSTLKSSGITGGYAGFENVQLATGIVRLPSVFVSSPGINSVLILRDSNKSSLGNSTFTITPIAGDNTETFGEIPYLFESSTQGIVYTSTCGACSAAWAAPRLRFILERVR